MSKRIFLLILCLNLLPFYIFAQQPWKPGFVAEAGFLAGSHEPSGDLRATGLLAKNNWQVGAGAGIDFYRYRSVPVYAHSRKYFGHRKSKPFLLASMGFNIATPTDAQKGNNNDFWTWAPLPSSSYSGGWYAEGGAGYAWLNKKGRGATFSLAYTFKSIEENVGNPAWMGDAVYSTTNRQNVYYMSRLALRIGYKF